ncbi:MAG: hypothetical protein AMS24_01775 [Chlamydiae bacterium SM23_39]|nr:MAG: hypothetical protein AMS24_01775 [Chlamydiae bacterium SM23_39]
MVIFFHKKIFSHFYKNHTFLIFSIFFLLGISLKFYFTLILFIPFVFFPSKKLFFIFIFGYLYALFYYPSLLYLQTPTTIQGVFYPHSTIAHKKTLFIKGILKNFHISKEKKRYKSFPCTLKIKNNRFFSSNLSYYVEGITTSKTRYNLYLEAKKITPYKKLKNIIPLRSFVKKKIKKNIKKNVKSKKASNFLTTLATATSPNKFLKFSFKRVGLEHIMAISGLHFGIITIFFFIILRYFIPHFKIPFILIIIINIYFLYIGKSPSTLRAYITIQIALIAQILNRKNNPLNTLGIALFFQLILDPIYITAIGFQLSFLSVFGILLIYPSLNNFLSNFILKRNKNDLKALSLTSKCAAILLNYFRETLSITLSVNILLIPILLFIFHKFSILSLIYNIFFPPLILISLLLMIFSFFFYIISPSISLFLNIINSYFTKFILHVISYPPKNLEFFIRTKNISLEMIYLYIIIFFYVAILLKYKNNYLVIPKNLHYF